MVKIIRFSMARMCHGLNCPFQHGWKVSLPKLEYVMVKIVNSWMAGMCHGQNCQFQNRWNLSLSKLSVSACL
jgi:hypothetical protein